MLDRKSLAGVPALFSESAPMHRLSIVAAALILGCVVSWQADRVSAEEIVKLAADDGFRGIWYANQPSGDEYKFKYSGGMATYPQQHVPIAVYCEEADKTFFCYGGRPRERNRLLHMLSYYDHQTGKVARPRILLDKGTGDAHDNPTLQVDGEGHLWIFSNSHGTSRPSFVHRSRRPYAIDEFERVRTTNFSYGQPWFFKEQGFIFLHTLYDRGRRFLHVSRSRDGVEWESPIPLARVAQGHYQVSWNHDQTLGTAFNYHPQGQGLNWRTNLYYLQSGDGGHTWQNAAGADVSLPLQEVDNPALAAEYESQNRLVYLKDLQFTAEGHPVVLYLTSAGYESGPKNDPRIFTTARWTGDGWDIREITHADNNYDYASLYIEEDDKWRLIGTTEQGPQRFNTGGEVAMWISTDAGRSWRRTKQLTQNSKLNHNFPRRPLAAHPDFYTLWADGHARQPSKSRLYFTDREGSHVWMLPEEIAPGEEMVRPIEVK